MPTSSHNQNTATAIPDISSLNGAHLRTLDAIFRHPIAHNLDWNDVLGLIGSIGDVHEKANREFVFEVGGQHRTLHKAHEKDLTSTEIIDFRHFLAQAGFSPVQSAGSHADTTRPAPGILVVIDHREAKIFHVDVSSDDETAHVIRPSDPHHILHRLINAGQSREEVKEPAYYEAIAKALDPGARIVVVGAGTGSSNAAYHLTAYLHAHHGDGHITQASTPRLSSLTMPQLLDLARQALRC